MAAGKGLLAILTAGKGKPAPGEDSERDEEATEDTGGSASVGKRAAQDAIDAITAGDAAGLYEALERVVKACQGGGESEME